MAKANPKIRDVQTFVSPARGRLLGTLSIFGSTFFLYLATVVIRWSEDQVTIDPSYFVFARFALGFVVVAIVIWVRRIRLGLYRSHLLIGRAVTNCISVFCFYKAVAMVTVAEANILNMTYPLFVGLYSWLFLKRQRDFTGTVTLCVAFVGIWLVLAPTQMEVHPGNLWGLSSGILAAAAIIYLNISQSQRLKKG